MATAIQLVIFAGFMTWMYARYVKASERANTLDQQLDSAFGLLERIENEGGPDVDWYRDWFKLTGDHMMLTEDGWDVGANKAQYIADDPEWKPLLEVNAPEVEGE